MSLKIAVLKEDIKIEKRVSASPDTVKKLASLGCEVRVEQNAGTGAAYTNEDFRASGAIIVKDTAELCKNADIVLCVQPPPDATIKSIGKGVILIGMLAPYQNDALLSSLASAKINSFSMELVPRITRAQAMDVLSSQANLAGYKAVLDAAEHFDRAFPMMMTAAGTIPPARVFIMGAGVAGLQAIATAKRLGAIVSATDVRPAAKEQVESLGGSFIAVEDEEFKEAETAGGYAKQMSKAYQAKQAALIEETIAKQDIVITTALIPGREAPKLISEKMVKSMKPGSVIVDLAVEQGGNCALSEAGKVIRKHDVTLVGHRNIPGRIATSASSLYAKNLLNLLTLLIDRESGDLAIDWNDEIIKGIALTKDGTIIHPQFANKNRDPKTSPAKKPIKKTVQRKTSTKKTGTKKTTPPKNPGKKSGKKAQ